MNKVLVTLLATTVALMAAGQSGAVTKRPPCLPGQCGRPA
jgi:hypothetical protein